MFILIRISSWRLLKRAGWQLIWESNPPLPNQVFGSTLTTALMASTPSASFVFLRDRRSSTRCPAAAPSHYCWIRFSKIQENSIFTGKMERPNRWWNMSAEPWDLSEFFPISIVAVGVTFIKIIWRFVQNGPNWSLFLLKTDFIFLSVDLNQFYHCSVVPSYN